VRDLSKVREVFMDRNRSGLEIPPVCTERVNKISRYLNRFAFNSDLHSTTMTRIQICSSTSNFCYMISNLIRLERFSSVNYLCGCKLQK